MKPTMENLLSKTLLRRFHQAIKIKLLQMKAILSKPFFKKYGKKALIIYLCWCVLKGILFLVAGWLLF
jgi:hypothetical protein